MFLIALSILLTAAGQVFLKVAVLHPECRWHYLGSGYALFFSTVFISYYLMKFVALKTFTVIMSLNYVVVMLISAVFFKEKLSVPKILGTLLVLFGIYVFNK